MATLCYVNFKGNAREAIQYYQSIFKGPKPEIMTYADFHDPNYQPPDHIKHLIIHAEIHVFDSRVMISDTPDGFGNDLVQGSNFSLAIVSDDLSKLKEAWQLMAGESKVLTDFQPSFFSEGYGYLMDRFGIYWQFIHEK
jgi:PhnB protein